MTPVKKKKKRERNYETRERIIIHWTKRQLAPLGMIHG